MWGYSAAKGEFILWCPNCKYKTEPFDNKNAVISFWSLMNRKGDEQVLSNWIKNFKKQFPNDEQQVEAA